MKIHGKVGAAHILDGLMGKVLRRRAVRRAGEDAVHIQIEEGHAPADRVDAQRIHGRIEIHRTAQPLGMLFQAAVEQVEDILALQLIAVNAGDDTDALAAVLAGQRRQMIFVQLQVLVYREAQAGHNLFHFSHFLYTI